MQIAPLYEHIISVKNLCEAWREFIRDKKDKKDVVEFALDLSQNIFELHEDLKAKTYIHGGYKAFKINDPKPRDIHKATVRDRLLHHAVYRVLCPYFDRKFIFDSYSCRYMKGNHKPLNRFRDFGRKASQNNSRTCFVLKCDVRKFFASIDQYILLEILCKHIEDKDILWLIGKIVESFWSTEAGKGLPLGNLTSQLLINVYMNEFDQFIKHKLKVKCYIRYADDFVVFDRDRKYLEAVLEEIGYYLHTQLDLKLHPDKVFIKTLASGVDFLGWVHFPNHRVLRTVTKRRMMRRIVETERKPETIQSYRGLLKHGNGYKLMQRIL